MLKSIANTLKTMGEAFTLANTGDMLNDQQKAEVLAPLQSSTAASPFSQKTPVYYNEELTDSI